MQTVGRTFFAVSLAAFGIMQFLFGDFVPGRAPPWPGGVPGQAIWAYATGAFFVLTGIALLARRREAVAAAIVAGALIFVWAFLRQIPAVLADHQVGAAWTFAGKALMLAGGVLAVGHSRFRTVGQVCLGAFLVLGGIQHFLWTDFVATLVPAWIPGGPVFWTYFAGAALIAGGLGMNFPPTARLAAMLSGAMVLAWVVLLHVPRALAAATPKAQANEWIAVFEALAVAGIAFVLGEPRRS